MPEVNNTHINNHNQTELWYGTPLWAVRILMLICIIFATLFGLAGFHYDTWAPNDPAALQYFFYVLCVAFASAALRPRNWQRWTYFIASHKGIAFPSEVPESRSTTWLVVPWSRVGEIKESRLVGNKTGPALEIMISAEDQEKYFPEKRIMENIFGNAISRPEYTVVGYSNLFIKQARAVNTLNRLKATFAWLLHFETNRYLDEMNLLPVSTRLNTHTSNKEKGNVQT